MRRALLFLSIAAAAVAATAQTAELRLASTAWPPFTNEPGQARFALDLVEAALKRVGLRSKTTIVEAAQFTPSILSDAFDGSAAAWKDPERERVLVFSQPYLENRLILIGRRGDDVSAAALADLKDKRIAIVEGYSYGAALENSGPAFVRSKSEEDSLRLLLDKAADYALMDELVVQHLVGTYPEEARKNLQLGSKPLVTLPLYFAVRRSHPDAESIITRFNSQIRAMIADRTYHRLLHVAWIRADVDGDGVAEYVPQSDLSGTAEPKRAYTLFSTDQLTPESSKPRFYVGGSIYTDWASVPNRYKVEDPKWPDASRSTASLFRFVW